MDENGTCTVNADSNEFDHFQDGFENFFAFVPALRDIMPLP